MMISDKEIKLPCLVTDSTRGARRKVVSTSVITWRSVVVHRWSPAMNEPAEDS